MPPLNVLLAKWLMVTCALLLSGCQSQEIRKPDGRYTDGRYGVFVFRDNGEFGYQHAAKIDFYDKGNLPPHRGRWEMTSDGEVKIDLKGDHWKIFNLDWKPETNSFDLIFDNPSEPAGDFPPVITYTKNKRKELSGMGVEKIQAVYSENREGGEE